MRIGGASWQHLAIVWRGEAGMARQSRTQGRWSCGESSGLSLQLSLSQLRQGNIVGRVPTLYQTQRIRVICQVASARGYHWGRASSSNG